MWGLRQSGPCLSPSFGSPWLSSFHELGNMVLGSPDIQPPSKTRLSRGSPLSPRDYATIPGKNSDWLLESHAHSRTNHCAEGWGGVVLEITCLRKPGMEGGATITDSLLESRRHGSPKETCKQNHISSTKCQIDLFQQTRQEKSAVRTLPVLSPGSLQCMRPP